MREKKVLNKIDLFENILHIGYFFKILVSQSFLYRNFTVFKIYDLPFLVKIEHKVIKCIIFGRIVNPIHYSIPRMAFKFLSESLFFILCICFLS